MKGKYRVIVQNKRIRYDFEIKRNITVLRGDSASGKTVLVEMIQEFYENGPDSGVQLSCDKPCTVLTGKNWEMQLSAMHDSIVFIDEGNGFTAAKEFTAQIQKTDNYYVIVSRERLSTLPYSVEEVYGIRDSGRYGYLKRTYNEFYHLYGKHAYDRPGPVTPELVITEDSNAGYQFFCNVCLKRKKACISAQGKSNIFSAAKNRGEETLIIADGAAFGSEMEKMTKLLDINDRLHLYLPESFEWMILKSGLLEDGSIKNILQEPYHYIESAEDFSWERYFTKLLVSSTADTYLKYAKRDLNPVYMQENVEMKILQVMENIWFES